MMAPNDRPALAGDVAARQGLELALHGGFDGGGEAGVVGDQDGLRGGVVLGLRQQVGRQPFGIVVLVGDDQHLGRSGDGIDADRAVHLPLGGGDVGVAGADDLDHRADRLGAEGERGHRLRAADAIDLGDAGQMRRGQHQRVHLAAGRRHHHGDARHAGDPGRHGVHQHGAWIAGEAAGDVEADRLDGRPARAELGALRIAIAVVAGELAAVVAVDARMRQLEGGHASSRSQAATAAAISAAVTRMPVLARSSRSKRCVSSVERGIAARAHVGDDGAHGVVDIRRGLALGGEEGRERAFEVRHRWCSVAGASAGLGRLADREF